MTKKLLPTCPTGLSAFGQVRVQLTITEIQTQQNGTNSPGKKDPDWCELSNFGTNRIVLTGYGWNDGGHAAQGAATEQLWFTAFI